jgi:hypothetical protein
VKLARYKFRSAPDTPAGVLQASSQPAPSAGAVAPLPPASTEDSTAGSEKGSRGVAPGTDSRPASAGQNQPIGPERAIGVGSVAPQAIKPELSPLAKMASKAKAKNERMRVPVSPRSRAILSDYTAEAKALLVGLGLNHLLRGFDPRELLQAGEEMRSCRIPLNVLLTRFVRDPKTVEDAELRARIEAALVIIERLGGNL